MAKNKCDLTGFNTAVEALQEQYPELSREVIEERVKQSLKEAGVELAFGDTVQDPSVELAEEAAREATAAMDSEAKSKESKAGKELNTENEKAKTGENAADEEGNVDPSIRKAAQIRQALLENTDEQVRLVRDAESRDVRNSEKAKKIREELPQLKARQVQLETAREEALNLARSEEDFDSSKRRYSGY